MVLTYKVTGMTCSGCAKTVEKALLQVADIQQAKVNLANGQVEIEAAQLPVLTSLQNALSAYTYQISEKETVSSKNNLIPVFWKDSKIWKRASLNTLNCLVGCSIGDFGMIFYLQAFHPGISMGAQMALGTIAGLFTSVMLETILLKSRENFSWALAFQTAFSMSFLSMVAMELAMNTTDFMMTGGKAAFANPMYWIALAVALVAGFIAPLPYNYYKLKKYNKACH